MKAKTPLVRVTDTGEATACHTLGSLIAGWPDQCQVANVYTKKTPYRNKETPGEISYVINKESCESVKRRNERGEEEHEFTAHDILSGYREKPQPGEQSAAFAALDAVIDQFNPTDAQRIAVRRALASALGHSMAAFLANLRIISGLWKQATPQQRIVRAKKGPLKPGESGVEVIVVPLHGGEEAREKWNVKS